MTAAELRSKYLEFFKQRGHAVIPSASLVPENDPTVLFTTAGMHPLVPFLMGEPHPAGNRLVNYQRCIRTGDIDLVGDDTHLTFFEMLGNWSLGDSAAENGIGAGYFKEDAIKWSWEFLTGKEWLNLDPSRIYVTCFAGDENAEKDTESAEIWKQAGMPEDHIAFLGKEDNWWGPAGKTGPCGPDTEMFYQVNTTEDDRPGDVAWPKGKYVEIWNDVFMQYFKKEDGSYEPLKQKNVDTGMGLERTLAVLQGVDSPYETDVFAPRLQMIRDNAGAYDEGAARVIVDHLTASIFLIADGIIPSNKDQGYVLRRLTRKTVREADKIHFKGLDALFTATIAQYSEVYPDLLNEESIWATFDAEVQKFMKTVTKGYKHLEKLVPSLHEDGSKSGAVAFDLYQTYGYPPELTFDALKELGVGIEKYMFDSLYKEYLQQHQQKSRAGAEQKFAGGLADHSDRVVRMHTATHLLHQALRDVLGPHVFQKGSNITAERLRFDFTHPAKMTSEEIKKVEDLVNEKIGAAMEVTRKVIPLEEARKMGAIGLFGEKYGDTVSVYLMGDYSKEFCGGPHVKNTKEVGTFRILKEEAVSAGIRRIKAVVE